MVQAAMQHVGTPVLERERFSPENRRRLSGPGLRTFLALADLWRLTENERLAILGFPSRSTYHSWCQKARRGEGITLDLDQLTRLSAVLGIHQALMVLFPSEAEGIAWLRTPHASTAFGGQRPLDLVTSGTQDGLIYVRRFLDGARGGIYMPPNAADIDFTPYEDGDLVFK
jgi:uncharacterized protein (DUF2384 family)